MSVSGLVKAESAPAHRKTVVTEYRSMKVSTEEKISVVNLLNFVREIYDIKRPFNGNIEKAYIDWNDIDPELPGVSKWTPSSQDPNLLCVIERLSVPKPPQPDPELEDWVKIGADGSVLVKEQMEYADRDEDGNEILIIENFADDPKRVELKAAYLEEIAQWNADADLIRRGNALFDTFLMYRDEVLSSNLKKEMVLGNFIFDSSTHPVRDSIKYPILTSSVEVIVLADTKAKLAVRLTPDEKTVVHNEIFVAFEKDNLNGQEFDSIKPLINEQNCNLVDAEGYRNVFANNSVRLSTKCRWRESREDKRREDEVYFQIYPMPIFFVQTKATGLKEAVGSIVQKIEKSGEIPAHLVEIASPDRTPSVAPEDDVEPSFELKLARTAGEDPEILLAKTANAEQLTIASDIENDQNDVLLVQGPPGTGKTHTIANLMGHFLAQGKRILVTSETVKALSVLKEKLPEAVQPLCVSRLGDKKDLLSTAQHLQDELCVKTATQLKKSIARREEERKTLIADLSRIRKQIYVLRQKDGENITYNGRGYSFIELAKLIRAGEKEYASLIPGHILKGAACPNPDDVKEIYATNGRWSPEEENELAIDLPLSSSLPTPEECEQMFEAIAAVCRKYSANEATVTETTRRDLNGCEYVDFRLNNKVCIEVPKVSRPLLSEIDVADFDILRVRESVIDRMLTIGADDPQLIDKVAEISAVLEEIKDATNRMRFADKVFELKPTCNTTLVDKAATWFVENRSDGKITSFERMRAKLIKPESVEMEEVLTAALNGSDFPSSADEFNTVLLANSVIKGKQQVVRIWNRFVADAETPALDAADSESVDGLLAKSEQIREALAWWREVYEPLDRRFESAGLTSDYLVSSELLQPNQRIAMARTFAEILIKVVVHESFANDGEQFEEWRSEALSRLTSNGGNSAVLKELRDALTSDGIGYGAAYERLVALEGERGRYRRRAELLRALNDVAPDWARAILEKRAGFDCTLMPANFVKAWEWKQLELLYLELASLTIEELQKEATRGAARLRECTADLAADKAWLAVKLRLEGSGELSALSMMATLMSKAKGSGKNVERNRQAAIQLLPKCNRAVPAWIMTLDEAIGSFGSAGQFDIIIVDEASQADITALPILFMSKKIIVVGDDKQVTPDTVATQIERVNSLADQYLKNYVKSPALYDMKMSLYSLIKANAFRSRMLVEHFRCVPDIIGFSNALCYEGKIRPLRDKNDTNLMPAIVPWRVDFREADDAVDSEANAAIDLINAMIAQPEYKGKTFGLIAMRSSNGEVERLRTLVNEKIDPKEKEEREILCGTSAQFQGDERDVILMLLCDTAVPGAMLRLLRANARDDEAMKRFNVAVSRAKDQLWVIHSFDPASQLRSEDIRTRLFAWIKGTATAGAQEETIRTLADSEFEVEVAKALISRGYKIEQQHEVGSFKIDIVVHGKNAAVALECDGERYHSSDEAVRHDMERQAILERNGWRFIRLRGGEYFRNPEKAMDRVYQELAEKGIEPNVESDGVEASALLERIRLTLETGKVQMPAEHSVENNRLAVQVKPIVPTVESTIDDLPDTIVPERSNTWRDSLSKSAGTAAATLEEALEEDNPDSTDEEVSHPEPAQPEGPKENTIEETVKDRREEATAHHASTAELPKADATQTHDKCDEGKFEFANEGWKFSPEKQSVPSVKPEASRSAVELKPKEKEIEKPKAKPKTVSTSSKKKPVKKPTVAGLESSPVPTEAYSKRLGLTEADRKRIIEEDAVIWSELEALGCVLIDKRHRKGALWIVPPPGVEIKDTIFSLARRFKVSFVRSQGGKATHHTPGWFMAINNR